MAVKTLGTQTDAPRAVSAKPGGGFFHRALVTGTLALALAAPLAVSPPTPAQAGKPKAEAAPADTVSQVLGPLEKLAKDFAGNGNIQGELETYARIFEEGGLLGPILTAEGKYEEAFNLHMGLAGLHEKLVKRHNGANLPKERDIAKAGQQAALADAYRARAEGLTAKGDAESIKSAVYWYQQCIYADWGAMRVCSGMAQYGATGDIKTEGKRMHAAAVAQANSDLGAQALALEKTGASADAASARARADSLQDKNKASP